MIKNPTSNPARTAGPTQPTKPAEKAPAAPAASTPEPAAKANGWGPKGSGTGQPATPARPAAKSWVGALKANLKAAETAVRADLKSAGTTIKADLKSGGAALKASEAAVKAELKKGEGLAESAAKSVAKAVILPSLATATGAAHALFGANAQAKSQAPAGPVAPKADLDTLGHPKNIDQAFDQLVSSSSGPAQVRRHTDNVMAWNSKWDLVTNAKKTVDFSYFSIERDAYGYAYMGALLNQQMKGVQVTGVTDYMANSRGHGFVSAGLGGDYMQELAAHGAKIGIYDTLSTRAKSLVNDGLTYKAISSDHDKLSVSDAGTPDAQGETGGRNVAGAYHEDPLDNPGSWRDDSIQIKGPTTDGLVKALHRELAGPAVTMVKPDLINLKPRATEMLGAYAMMDTWMKAGPLTPDQRGKLGLAPGSSPSALSTEDKAKLRKDPAAKKVLAGMLLEESLKNLRTLPGIPDDVRGKKLSGGEMKNLEKFSNELANDLELRGSKTKYDNLGGYLPADVKIMDQVGAASAAPGARFNEMAPDMLHLIRGSQKEIVIENPYVVLTEPMMAELEAASKRGVKISIVTNSPESTDSAVTQGFFLNDWKNLEARVPNARIFVATGERKFHSKAFVLDGKVSGDTSYNADLLSAMVNGEVGAITRSEAVAQNLMGAIYDDLKNPANKFKEWTIKRNDDGTPTRDATGELIAIEGPEQTVSHKLQQRYKPVQFLCDLLTHTKLGSPLTLLTARPDGDPH